MHECKYFNVTEEIIKLDIRFKFGFIEFVTSLPLVSSCRVFLSRSTGLYAVNTVIILNNVHFPSVLTFLQHILVNSSNFNINIFSNKIICYFHQIFFCFAKIGKIIFLYYMHFCNNALFEENPAQEALMDSQGDKKIQYHFNKKLENKHTMYKEIF